MVHVSQPQTYAYKLQTTITKLDIALSTEYIKVTGFYDLDGTKNFSIRTETRLFRCEPKMIMIWTGGRRIRVMVRISFWCNGIRKGK